jgi:hypothetical protein
MGFIGKLFLGMLTDFAKVVKMSKKKGGLSLRNEMPQTPILYCEIFLCMGHGFYGTLS